MGLYFRILSYIKPYIGRLVMASLCTVVAAGGNLYLPWIIKEIIDQVLAEKNAVMLNWVVTSILVVFAIRGVFQYGQNYLMSYVGERVVIDIRSDVYRKLQRLSVSFYDKNKTGTIMSYVTNDVSALQNAMVQNTIEMITEGCILIGSLAAMIYLNWKLTLFTVLMAPVVVGLLRVFGMKIRKAGSRIQESTADITSILQEAISSPRIIKSFVRESFEIGRFEDENFNNFRANMKNAQLTSLQTPVLEFVAALAVTAVIWYGGHNVIHGEISAGELVAFLVYAVNISNPVKRLSRVLASIQKALAAAERVFGILDMEDTVTDSPTALPLPEVKGAVEFSHVGFAYNPGEQILEDVSFAVEPGKVVALVGPSGAGKSTVANLLPRFYDVSSGSITVDGQDIREVTLASLREQVGIVPQETTLFNGSVYDNILYGRLDATREEVEEAARAANAHSFIMELPEGYETKLGDRGLNLSGGQRQRIAIARAILKNPRILVLDEATSALDTESERVVQEALDRLMVGRTSFVIAHRLSTIQNADTIIVLDKGRIVEQGTHHQLMELEGLYAHLHEIQFRAAQEEAEE